MKKIRKIFLFALVAIIAAGGVGWYFLTHETVLPTKAAPETPTFVDSGGTPHNVVVDTNGVTYAVVADSDRNVWQVEINPDGSLGQTVASLNEYILPEDVLTTGELTAQNAADEPLKQNEASQPTSGSFSNHPELTTQGQSESTTTAPVTQTTAPQVQKLNFEKYRDMYSGGTYYMVFTTNDETLGDVPISSAKKGSNILVTTTVEGMTGTVIYNAEKDKTYFVVDEWKRYFSLPKSMLGDDIDMSELDLLSGFFSPEIKTSKFKVKNVEIDGEQLVCESYKTKSGAVRDYYFKDGTLVRIDSVDEDGTSSEFYIKSVTNEVSDSLFEIPSDYRYLNLSWL